MFDAREAYRESFGRYQGEEIDLWTLKRRLLDIRTKYVADLPPEYDLVDLYEDGRRESWVTVSRPGFYQVNLPGE